MERVTASDLTDALIEPEPSLLTKDVKKASDSDVPAGQKRRSHRASSTCKRVVAGAPPGDPRLVPGIRSLCKRFVAGAPLRFASSPPSELVGVCDRERWLSDAVEPDRGFDRIPASARDSIIKNRALMDATRALRLVPTSRCRLCAGRGEDEINFFETGRIEASTVTPVASTVTQFRLRSRN